MLPYIIAGVLAVFALLGAVIAMQPKHFRVARSMRMGGPPEAAFDLVNDFREWTKWSPWEKYDPDLQRAYSGAATGVGAVYSWSGNKHVGEGRSTIVESRKGELIRVKLEFLRPFKANNDVVFTFEREGSQTVVSWIMTGERTFMFKAMGLLMNMDKMCGGQFEQGLATLKAAVESKLPSAVAALV